MSKFLKNAAMVVGTIGLMLVSGFLAFYWAISMLFGLGLKYHNAYEYYGYTYPVSSELFILAATAIGFAAPAPFVCWLGKNHWRFSLWCLRSLPRWWRCC